MQARRDEAKHMEALTVRVLQQHQHAVLIKLSTQLMSPSDAVTLPLLFLTPLPCVIRWEGGEII